MAEDQPETKPSCFNGGKMYHIFAFNDETKRYESEFSSPEAEEAFEHGTLYYKIDGSNGMVQAIQDEESTTPPTVKIYQRLDTKGKDPNGDTTVTPLPSGKNPSVYPGHSYCYSEITEDVSGKKLVKRNRAMLELVQRHLEKFVSREWTSVEWVGTMFNKTPNVPHPIALAIHEEQRVVPCNNGEDKQDGDLAMERTFDGARKCLLEDCVDQPIEGFIIEHGGRYWKVRSDCFLLPPGTKDPFRVNRDNSRPPVFLV